MKSPQPDSTVRSERGAALVTVILMMVLIAVLVVSYLSIVSGERAMSSSVHVAKGALYAADAGVRIAEQNLANVGKKRLDSLVAIYTGSGAVIKQPSLVFPQGAIVSTATSPNFNASTTVSFSDSIFAATSQIYNFQYTITSSGTQGSLGARKVQSTGTLRLSAGRGSFADYLLYTNTHTMADGSNIWLTSSGYFEGRVHTNTQFRFMGRPTFEDLVTQVNAQAWYFNNGSNVQVNDDHYKTSDVPNFYGGFKRSQASVDLPTNPYNQQNAALGLDPSSSAAPDNATIRTQLGLAPAAGTPPNGVYVPSLLGSAIGGIYVHGNLDKCVTSVDASGRQVYTMTQGAKVYTVTIDRTLNTTTIVQSGGGGGTTILLGQPRGIVYTVGSMLDIGGPTRVGQVIPPGIADNTSVLMVATNDIVVQRDITYKDFYNGQSVLGLYSYGGNVRIGASTPNDVQINAFVMAAGASGCFQVDNYSSGAPRGAVHLKGGTITQFYGAFGQFNSSGSITHGYARDFHYDDRGVIPPYFPTTATYVSNLPKAHTQVWKEL